jgi:hypothetical protein
VRVEVEDHEPAAVEEHEDSDGFDLGTVHADREVAVRPGHGRVLDGRQLGPRPVGDRCRTRDLAELDDGGAIERKRRGRIGESHHHLELRIDHRGPPLLVSRGPVV